MGRGTKHILVIRLSAMGDVAMTVPVVRCLVAQNENVKVTVVSKAAYKPFFDDIPRVNFFEADTQGRHKGIFGLFRLYEELGKLHIYAVADLHNVLRSKIITKLFAFRGKKTATVDKVRSQKAALTSHNVAKKVFGPLLPVTERYAKVFEALGLQIDLKAHIYPEKKELTADILEHTGPKTGTWIGIAPFAQHEGKVYPKKQMQKVIDLLAEVPGYSLMLFGGGRPEVSQLKKFADKRENIVVVAGRMNLKQEMKLISNLDLMLSMDSGNAHIAAMQGVKVITLWGATHPYTGFAPFGQPADNALTSDRNQYPLLPTSVYGNLKVKGYEDVMMTIAPETVVYKIKEVLK